MWGWAHISHWRNLTQRRTDYNYKYVNMYNISTQVCKQKPLGCLEVTLQSFREIFSHNSQFVFIKQIISKGSILAVKWMKSWLWCKMKNRLTLMRTNTSTGTKSSAPGTESSLARLRRFMMVEHMRSIHWTLSRGVLYALMVLISDWAEGQGASFR